MLTACRCQGQVVGSMICQTQKEFLVHQPRCWMSAKDGKLEFTQHVVHVVIHNVCDAWWKAPQRGCATTAWMFKPLSTWAVTSWQLRSVDYPKGLGR